MTMAVAIYTAKKTKKMTMTEFMVTLVVVGLEVVVLGQNKR